MFVRSSAALTSALTFVWLFRPPGLIELDLRMSCGFRLNLFFSDALLPVRDGLLATCSKGMEQLFNGIQGPVDSSFDRQKYHDPVVKLAGKIMTGSYQEKLDKL